MDYFADTYKDIGKYIWYGENSGGRTHPVGEKENANAWGLCDLHGNVLQWCQDWYGDYQPNVVNPQGPEQGTSRVVRGGYWASGPDGCLSASRSGHTPDFRHEGIGFRVCFFTE